MHKLQIQNLFKEFDGIKAVDHLSLDVEDNSIVALVGPNGSGKTTIFNLVTGFLRPDNGRVFFDRKNITSLSPYKVARLGIGRTFQNIRLFPQISVLDNVMLGLRYDAGEGFWAALFQTGKMKRQEERNRQRAQEILKLIGLSEKRDALAENLSHGQRKLLELARILALDPKVLLLDEPFAGLFPETKKFMLDFLKNLKTRGKTIVFIEHNINTVTGLAEKVIVLNEGKKIAEGMPEEIRENEEVRRVYLGKTNS
jgi:branched-chain amino acid transport system ATP-binding protein